MLEFPVIGQWKPGEIAISWTSSSRPLIPQVEELIEQAWQKAMARPGVHLFDGPMCRLESMSAKAGRMDLLLSPASYKQFVGTNMGNPALADVYGQQVLANPVGLSTLLLSSDRYLLMGRRNASVAYYPSRVHPFAGCLEPADQLDVFADVRRELREELSLNDQDIAEMTCTGIARDISLRQPELILAATSTRTFTQIESQLDPHEHRGVFRIPATREAVEAALHSNEAFTPVGIAAILLWGRTQFGDDWFSTISKQFVQ